MTLVELCEPLFQHVCRLSRGARKGVSPDPGQARAEISSLFGDLRARAASTPGLAEPYEKIEIVLMYFVDSMIRESRLSFARQWQELAHEKNKLAGDEDFFDELDRTLAEPDSDSVRQRLAVFYTCLGLGFTGWYTGNHEHLRKKMNELASRLRGMMDADKASRVCPEAYENVNTADLVEPPARKLVGVGILIGGLAIAVFAANVVLFLENKKLLTGAVAEVIRQAETGRPVGDGATSGGEGSR
jgi:type IV/VI secretion system ImpK/VasF family protein